MEPINYRDALRRRWPRDRGHCPGGSHHRRPVPAQRPSRPRTQYAAAVLIGVTPGSKGHTSIGKIKFFAANQQVIVNAAKAAGIKGKPTALSKDITYPTTQEEEKEEQDPERGAPARREAADGQAVGQIDQRLRQVPGHVHRRAAAGRSTQASVRLTEQKISNLSNRSRTSTARSSGDTDHHDHHHIPTTTTTTKPKATTTTTTPTTTTAPRPRRPGRRGRRPPSPSPAGATPGRS